MRKNKNKGFSMVELIVVIAIMVVLLAILVPSVVRYTENSRMQRDESAMDEVCNAVQLAMADSKTFDEVFEYAIPNNYITYSDSSGVYGARYTDEEFWAPDGSGTGVTITFNPDGNGDYHLSEGIVNDMTFGNGSVADARTNTDVMQCYMNEMGKNKLLYNAVTRSIGETISEKSATYKNSSFTVFITYDLVNGTYRPDIYGLFNGTNLSETSPASLGSGTDSYTEEKEAITTKPGGTTTATFTNSDLSGGGTISGGPSTWNNPYSPPTLNGGGVFNKVTDTAPLVFTRGGQIKPIQDIKVNGNSIDAEKYISENNETVIRLNIDYLMQLAVGKYSLEVVSEAGSASAQFEIKNELQDTETMIYNADNLSPEIQYVDFTITAENRHKVGYTDSIKDYTIPSAFKENDTWYKVTKIGDKAFYECDNLVSVTVAETITSIGSYAFYYNDNLETMTIPGSVQTLEYRAFNGCKKMSNLNLGEGIKTIGNSCFNSCHGLINVTLPNSIETLNDGAFVYCHNLESITLSENLKTICYDAFYECFALKSITIPDSVETLESRVFSGCKSLTNIHIGKGVSSIGTVLTTNCPALTTITVDSANENYYAPLNVLLANDDSRLVAYPANSPMTEYTIPDGVIKIESQTFENCKNLTIVNVPNTVISIESTAFAHSSIETCNLGNNVSTIAGHAFWDCKNLKNINLPDSLTAFTGESAFMGCEKLDNITFPTTISEIPRLTFYRNRMKSITIPKNITTIGNWAFTATPIKDVYYLGTIEEWNNMVIDKEWNWGSYSITIHCTDGHLNYNDEIFSSLNNTSCPGDTCPLKS